ncbi:glutathione S-transferase family protein [Polyangium aurulentum]|uniref:glutathione S-transferase family protein n=1 Tax=Polyangium aurulentum TaxID=2567896 RepID=UPI0010AE342D|nr:glutathione S-transferase family protein [Polyangium aurulentum]UQA60776.1 glutathione S-transferase family protein [Polyangium aurulentum]
MLTIHGCKGCGSTVVETVCELLGEKYDRIEVNYDKPSPERDALEALNPLVQVPTVVTEDGTVITETVAIILWLLERHPGSDLAPPPGDPLRPVFLRKLVFFPSAIYPMYTVGDFTSRWVKDEAAQAELKEATIQRTLSCWGTIEASMGEGPFLLGQKMTVLDVYAAMMSRWRPGRERIRAVAPKAVAAAEQAEKHPVVAAVFARNFGE